MEEEKEANLRNFLEWAASLGISDSPDPRSPSPSCLGHSLSISHFPQAGGRGFAAVRDIKKGELILRVPKAALLTADAVISKEYKLSAALDKYPLLSSTQILSIALLHEVSKGRSSWWYPYITQIPRSYDLLFNFNQLEIEALQIDDAIWTTEKAVHKCKMEWEEASPLMSELHLKPQFVTYQAWLWASATVLLSYGTYTNLELLEHYGFLLHENPSDKAFIPLEPEMFSLYNGQRESLYISHDGKPSFSLLMTARLWVTPRSKRKSIKHIVCSGFQISVENEEFVLKWIVEKCRLLLSGYATSIEEDELLLCSLEEIQNYNKLSENREASAAPKDEIWRILESNNVERGELCGKLNISLKTRRSIDRWKLAVQWRRNYKKILFNCISQCDKILDINFC
ncbi:protein SET DOMAIN GROUP 40 isoform X3 [Henckelia pumila]|uniref:protein SET DOMAIN GROUP 40 isoform X3 n=1 Tax=Henckelia pumila TaxID=405737 RepID=UPI003C6E2F03